MKSEIDFIYQAKKTLDIEIKALQKLKSRIDDSFIDACDLIQKTMGRVIVIGMGKSGHVGKKIAATLASTGTPAFFVHPAEASHGDLGMITGDDVILAISNSGQTEEITAILPVIKRQGIKLIAMTGNVTSLLAQHADIHLSIAVEKEACPLNLAPTASTTVTLALGDALAIALLSNNGFKEADFARSHPGGKLGKRLLTYVRDVMKKSKALPLVIEKTSLLSTIMEISNKGLGVAIVCEKETQKIQGIFTDGDLRRLLDSKKGIIDLSSISIDDVMHQSPAMITADILAVEAVQIMEDKKISSIPVVDDNKHIVGIVTMLDLLNLGVI